jgi:DNA-binding NarL/FixJ family response regulator
MSVLIVEDNPVLREAIKGMLTIRFPSIGVEEASNGEEALSVFKKTLPVLIFMDIGLPGKNGLEVTREIKETNSETEIIILTSYDTPEYREAAFRSGASYFLAKGNAKIDDIISVVTCALEADSKCRIGYPIRLSDGI